jgi:hypothetical protein
MNNFKCVVCWKDYSIIKAWDDPWQILHIWTMEYLLCSKHKINREYQGYYCEYCSADIDRWSEYCPNCWSHFWIWWWKYKYTCNDNINFKIISES